MMLKELSGMHPSQHGENGGKEAWSVQQSSQKIDFFISSADTHAAGSNELCLVL